MLRSLFGRLRRRPSIDTRDALLRFLDEQAALIAQKSVIGYCHVKTRLPLTELMRDPPFVEAFERGRWTAYAAVLADLVVAVEAHVRSPSVPTDAYVALFTAILSRHPAPPGAAAPEALAAALVARIIATRAAPPASLNDIAAVGAAQVFDALPIHARLRAADRPAVMASVRFLMVSLAPYFERRMDAPTLAAALTAGA